MSLLLNNLVNDDFLWDVIAAHLPYTRRSATSFTNFKCPMCGDYKPRCGIKRSSRIGIHCFNCAFDTRYQVGDYLSKKMAEFLHRIGVSDMEVKRLALHARAIKRAIDDAPKLPTAIAALTFEPNFANRELPEGSLPLGEWADLGCTDPHYVNAVEYALSRGDVVMRAADWHWTPAQGMQDRLILPFRFDDRIVGYTARTTIGDGNKYLNYMPQDFLFNNRVLEGDRDTVVVIEGPLDALAIDGVSPLGSTMNANQVAWLKATGKRIVVVADRDEAGDKMVTLARNNKWAVAFPGLKSNAQDWWDYDIKDCDEAVKRHGRLYVLKSILETATSNATEIEVKRRYLV